jgi:3-oxoacyl-(acyl-carrier-protein) synthase
MGKIEGSKQNELISKIGITGVGIGLPGKDRFVFDHNNFDAILKGKNFIEQIPIKIQEAICDKKVSQVKLVNGKKCKTVIEDVSKSVKLASQIGKMDLARDYGISESMVKVLDIASQLAIGAGFEALKDAHIPLIPQKMREDQNKLLKELNELISDPSEREKVKELLKKEKPNNEDFEFNRKFLFKTLVMANSQFAQIIGARGPNTQINSACASTTQAISIAEDWIRRGRCKRVIILGADNPTSDQTMEWIGTGFLAIGAASIKEKVEDAALPFDKRRDGMILGAGAVALILEEISEANERGIIPIVELMGTRVSNSAYTGTRMDKNHISKEMDKFFSSIEREYGSKREDMATSMLFMSHESYTPARGGGTAAEIGSLRTTFGSKASNIIITNTKGFTGHLMGANIEDGVAIKALEKGLIPPIANLAELDDELNDLYFSRGESKQVDYALRLAAGFGSQVVIALFRRLFEGDRFEDGKYDEWLEKIGGGKEKLGLEGKILVIRE